MFLLKLSFRPWRLAGISQVSSALVVGLLLSMMGVFYWIQSGLTPLLDQLQSDEVILAYLTPSSPSVTLSDEQVGEQEDQKIMDSIRVSLGSQAERVEIRRVNGDQFLGQLKVAYPELVREILDLGPEGKAVVPRYVSISGSFAMGGAAKVIDRLKAMNGVDSVASSHQRFEQVVGAFRALRTFIAVVVIGLGIALITGLVHLAKTNAFLHRESLSVLRQWGASGTLMRLPSILSCFWVGALGGGFAAIGWLLARSWLGLRVRNLSPLMSQFPHAPVSTAAFLLLAGMLLGLMAGLSTSSGAEER